MYLSRTQLRAVPLMQRAFSAAPTGVEVMESLASSSLTEDQLAYRDLARDFAEAELAPHAAQWDRDSFFPVDKLRQAAGLGFGAMFCKEEFGGTGLGRVDGAVVFEELSAGCTSTTAFLTIHNMVAWMVDSFGDDVQRAQWVPQLASMDKIGSYCLTEPGSGSDAASLATKAVSDGDDYVLNGSKAFISGGGVSDVYFVMCRTGGAGAGGVSCVMVEKGTPGLSFGENEAKLGWKSQPTAAVFFDNVRVPKSNRLGKEGEGFKIAMKGLDGGRLSIGACSLGAASAALKAAGAYVHEREQFGKPIAANQALQFKVADMATDLHGARLVLRDAAKLMDRHKRATSGEVEEGEEAAIPVPGGATSVTVACAMAKVKATDTGFSVCNDALQLHGGYGYLNAYPLERYVRDVRVHQILEGTNEIMRHIVARAVLNK